MKDSYWVLIDTETTGFSSPIFVVELAAQRMRGWEPEGIAFRKLLNQNEEIPSEASRVHGYTREILERDGESAQTVYQEFTNYVGDLPIVSYNLQYDLDDVLMPEWKRLGIPQIGSRGFCALRLAQRLLDPVPAGNCKLQTLRQYYRLPERGAHTALGDVLTVSDLMAQVLRPIAGKKGLHTWEAILGFSTDEWFPSRIAFGKFKGRSIYDAIEDQELFNWLEWLAQSSSTRNSRMGQWYLNVLQQAAVNQSHSVFVDSEIEEFSDGSQTSESQNSEMVVYVNPELEHYRQLVALGRGRLAELEGRYTIEKSEVDLVQATLFRRLREHYQRRDRLHLIVDYRKRYLHVLVRMGEEEAKQEESHYEEAKSQSEKEYEETASAVAEKVQLTPEQEEELTNLWRKLVKLYHPDRVVNNEKKLETYDRLTMVINQAKDTGDIDTLRAIASDPEEFILSKGWDQVDFSEALEIAQLRRLYELLQIDIVGMIELLNQLRESPDYELCKLVEKEPGLLDDLVCDHKKQLDMECAELEAESSRLAEEIEELTGEVPDRIS